MTCYSPNHCFDGGLKENGKINVLWKAPAGTPRLSLPCGRCVGCHLERSREWADRCMCEAQFYERNCFVTLTFDKSFLPQNRSLDIRHCQLFLKRLRKQYGKGIRTFYCGEYGGKLGRPHYHFILFNHDFDDKLLFTIRNGNKLYTSVSLQKLWPFGYSSIGDVSYATASYVARYSLKKVSTKDDEHYVDKVTGECLKPEFVQMSRGSKKLGTGGIGKAWFDKYMGDVFPSDQMVVNGKIHRPPRSFDKLLEKVDPQMLDVIKQRRYDNRPSYDESTDERLRVKEIVKLAQIKRLKRTMGDYDET